MILKAQNGPKTVARFEEYKEPVKAQCIADRNEIMQFHYLGPTSSSVTVYDACWGMWGFHGKKKEKQKNQLESKIYFDQAAHVPTLKSQLDQRKAVVYNLVSNTRLLESKIQDAGYPQSTCLVCEDCN
ncbi:hypothetical protein EV2_019744 [Malus domestica]